MAITYRAKQNQYSGTVDVTAISDVKDPDHGNSYPYGDIVVLAPKEVPNFEPQARRLDAQGMRSSTEQELTPSSEYRNHIGLGGWYDKSEEAALAQRPPTELFTHVSPQIRSAFVDPAIRHAMPTMVGIAMKRMNAEHDIPMADYSLTRWSSALSRGAAKRGLVVPHPHNPSMSDSEPHSGRTIPRNTTYNLDPDWVGPVVPQEDVRAGQQWVRSRLRESKAVRGESQFQEDPLSPSQREWQDGRINPGPGQESLF